MTEYLFDTNDRSLHIGQAAAQIRLEQASTGSVIPLQHLLELEELSFDTSEFDRKDCSEWTKEDVRNFGIWVLSVINVDGKSQALTRNHITRMYRLGLGPSSTFVRRYYPKMWKLRAEISSPVIAAPGRFEDWTEDDFTDYALRLATKLGRKPTEPDFDKAFEQGKGPSVFLISRLYEGIGELNRIIGYPNIHKWTREDYLNWGVRTLLANKESGLNRDEINRLSQLKRGPSVSTIFTHFGKLSVFQQLVYREIKQRTTTQQ